jgi:HK97 family phage portal protein
MVETVIKMGIVRSFLNIFKRSASDAATSDPNNGPRAGAVDLWVNGNAGALSVAAVYRCVNLLADSVANLPMQYLRAKDGIFVEDLNSRLHYLLTVQPCPYLSAFDFWRQIVQYLLLEGNAYIVPVYDAATMDISRLALVSPTAVAYNTLTDTYTVIDVQAGVYGTFAEEDIIHIKNFTRDGKVGLSTLTYARVAMNIASTGDRETLNRFANGGNVRGIITNDTSVRGFGEYQDNELSKTAKSLDEQFRTGARIVSIPGQAKFSPLSLSSTDMQFLETRKFSVRDICRFFGVHPSFVFDDTSNNYKSAEMANVAFLSNTLNPLLRRIENELHRKLVPQSLCCKRKFQFDRRGLYACDLDSRIKYQAQTIAAGLYTVNEWRREENKPAVEGGDTVLVSANLKGITESSAATAPTSNTTPTKDTEPETDKEPQENE